MYGKIIYMAVALFLGVTAAEARESISKQGVPIRFHNLPPCTERRVEILSPTNIILSPGTDTLSYDDGTAVSYFIDENAIWAVHFTPGTVCTIIGWLTMAYDFNAIGTPCSLYVWDDAGGLPGAMIAGPVAYTPASAPNWDYVALPTPVEVTTDFHLGYWMPGGPEAAGQHALIDAAGGERSNLFAGGRWIPLAGFGDLMIRAVVVRVGIARDITVTTVTTGEGSFIPNPGSVKISAFVKNAGDTTETNFDVVCVVTRGAAQVYIDTITIPSIAPGDSTLLSFSPNWEVTADGAYLITVTSHLTDDVSPDNNSKDAEVYVVTYPAELAYDDGTPENAWAYWSAGNGWAQRFDGGAYPLSIDSIRFNIWEAAWPSPGGDQMIAQILDDDGADGSPGTSLFNSGTITIVRGAWNTVPVAPAIQITDGSFYVAYIQADTLHLSPGLSEDQTPPISGQSWKYTDGAWEPCGKEFMIRAFVRGEIGIAEDPEYTKPEPIHLTSSPNPMWDRAEIRYSISHKGNVSLRIYDITGTLIRTVVEGVQSAGTETLEWKGTDNAGREVPSGVYFCVLKTDRESRIVKMVVIR